jgi:DnaK suppressor protein
MNTKDITLLTQRLLEKKTALLHAITRAMENSRRSDARLTFELVQDNPDRSVDELIKHVDSRILGTKTEELEAVECALLKIREGTYGTCESCGERISRKRLQVFPDALYCLDCQGRRERVDRFSDDLQARPKPPGTEAYLDDDE